MKTQGLYQFAVAILRPIFKLLYWYKVIGRENVPDDQPLLLCSNHTAYKDPIFLGISQKKQVRFMAKSELFKNKLLGWLISHLGAFPVERSGGVSAIHRGIEILKQKGIVGIFIEGTRSKTGEPLRPKPGFVMLAYETRATVVPIAIVGKNGKPPRVFSRTVVNIGKPIPFDELGMKDNSSMEMRKVSRAVMEQIKELRAEVLNGGK